jgi:tetratricopeptide (TPR) repeat protein
MYSKTEWITKFGPVTLVIALSVSSLAGQSGNLPMHFGFVEMDEARDLMNNGKTLLENGKYTEASEKFREVVKRFPRNPVAEQSNYYLVVSLSKLKKNAEALALIDKFLKERPKSAWASDIRELRVELSKQVPPEVLMQLTPRPPLPPEAPTTPIAARPVTPFGESVAIATPFGQTPAPAPAAVRPGAANVRVRPDDNPEVRLQLEVLRVLFENNPDRAIEISTDRLRTDPSDIVVLSSLHMVAQSRSDKAMPLLVTLARSPDSKTRRDAVGWIGRARGEKDAITDILVSLVPAMTGEEDSSAIAYALAQVNTPKAYDALASMARDMNKPERLRQSAVQSIGDAKLTNRVTLLEDIYKASSDNVRVRRTVAAALTHGKEPQVVTVLSNIATSDPDTNVKITAVNYLGQIKSPEALKALEMLLQKKP